MVRVSATTGEGLDDLRAALDDVLASASSPPETRSRLFVDRVFTIAGSGTVATGTLIGGPMAVGDEVELYPHGRTARIRSLQSHKRDADRVIPVARVAANLVGTGKGDLARGDVVGAAGAWRPTTVFEGILTPVRGLAHPITGRGAFKVYVGATEADARLRIFEGSRIEAGQRSYVRITTSRPLVLDVFDRFVLRESGRQETVGGGSVLDPAPPRRAGSAPESRLARRAAAARDELPAILAEERGAVTATDARILTGSDAAVPQAGDWLLRSDLLARIGPALVDHVAAFHDAHPLEEGEPVASARRALADLLRPDVGPPDPRLIDPILDRLVDDGLLVRTTTAVALPSRPGDEPGLDPAVQRVVEAISGRAHAAADDQGAGRAGDRARRGGCRDESRSGGPRRPRSGVPPRGRWSERRRSSPMPATPGSR